MSIYLDTRIYYTYNIGKYNLEYVYLNLLKSLGTMIFLFKIIKNGLKLVSVYMFLYF